MESVYDSYSHAHYPFLNHSDARLAALALTHDVPIYIINLFLDILRDKNFCYNDVSFSDASDIFKAIANAKAMRDIHRARRCSEVRSIDLNSKLTTNKKNPVQRDDPFHLTILDLVLDELHRQGEGDAEYRQVLIKTYDSMSRVHPSWTIPSKRSLGRLMRPINTREEGWRKVFCEPYLGPWTRRLNVIHDCQILKTQVGHPGRSRNSPTRHDIIDEFHLTNAAYSLCPNVETIIISTLKVPDVEIRHARVAILGLKSLQTLRTLTLNVSGSHFPLVHLCKIVPEFRSLQTLSIIYCRAGWLHRSTYPTYNNDIAEQLPRLPPCTSLRELNFDANTFPVRQLLPVLEWLARPRGSWSLKTIRIHSYSGNPDDNVRINELLQMLHAVQPAMPFLTSLELHAVIPPNHLSQQENIIDTTLQQCKSLESLGLCFRDHRYPYQLHHVLTNAPSTLRKISISSYHVKRDFGEGHSCAFSEYKGSKRFPTTGMTATQYEASYTL